ncbi:COX15/CtaA family protein [bacterium]|nr:COX15/CtaA family protein [bacterium]
MTSASPISRSALLTFGFGTSVAMWTLGYLGRVPPALTPSWLLGPLMLLCLPLGGYLAARYAGGGIVRGATTGLLASVLNLLILGSLLAEGTGWIWLPGSLVMGAALGALGALFAGKGEVQPRDFTPDFAYVTAAAAFLLLVAGGLVTSKDAGLAVPDWPNSFGNNMFMYPLSRMSGGIYFEHAHRLLGTLVGLSTLVLALQLWRGSFSRGVKRLGALALSAVIIQGILGGLRVTGRFTLSQDAAELTPSIGLAMLHGVLGQVFFAGLVLLAILSGGRWADARPRERDGVMKLARAFVLIVGLQLALGVLVRHVSWGLWIHISAAVIVLVLGLLAGARAWESVRGPAAKLGKILVALLLVQVTLGTFAAFFIWTREGGEAPAWEVLLATAHQATGALILAIATALAVWLYREPV